MRVATLVARALPCKGCCTHRGERRDGAGKVGLLLRQLVGKLGLVHLEQLQHAVRLAQQLGLRGAHASEPACACRCWRPSDEPAGAITKPSLAAEPSLSALTCQAWPASLSRAASSGSR